VPLACIPKRLRFYEYATKVVQNWVVPNCKQSFEGVLFLRASGQD